MSLWISRGLPFVIFQLTADKKSEVVAICDHLKTLKFSPVLPYAFTEHGAIMAATVLNSPRAIQVSIYVIWRNTNTHNKEETFGQVHR